MIVTGARAMVMGLLEQGVDTIFGYPGATICPFYDEMAKESDKLQHILVRQEQNAGHMASGYARKTGKVGACVVTSGPGATNLITGIATAYMDSIPIVAITGQVPSHQLGRDVFQEADITGATAPFVKHSYLVHDAADLPRIFREAFHIASTGRPGPVLIDVPSDVQNQEFEYKDPGKVNIRGYKPTTAGNMKQIKKVAEEIRSSKKPLIVAGGGVFHSGAQDLVKKLVAKTKAPVVTTMMGIGVLHSDDPMNLGMIGSFGNSPANYALHHNDLLIIIGARVADRAVVNPDKVEEITRTIHIDIDPAEIGKNMTPTVPLVGDIKLILEKLLKEDLATDSTDWLADVMKRSEDSRNRPMADRTGTIGPRRLMKAIGDRLDDNATVLADVGQNQIWAGKYINIREGRFLTSGGLGTMGYSLPAALGAKISDRSVQTICVCGDGGFQMTMNELSTMVGNDLGVKIVLLNNRKLGMVNEIQKNRFSQGPYGVFLPDTPDFCKVADAYGVKSVRLSDEKDIAAALDAMFADDKPFLLEAIVDADESTMNQ